MFTPFLPPQAQRYISQLKGQVNTLEAELEEQRKQKQKALVDNEQLRHELAQLRAAQLESERNQGLREEAESAWPGWGGQAQWERLVPSRGPSTELGVTASPLTRREGQCHRGALHQAEGAAQQAHRHTCRAAQEGRAHVQAAGKRREAWRPQSMSPSPVHTERRHGQAADG